MNDNKAQWRDELRDAAGPLLAMLALTVVALTVVGALIIFAAAVWWVR